MLGTVVFLEDFFFGVENLPILGKVVILSSVGVSSDSVASKETIGRRTSQDTLSTLRIPDLRLARICIDLLSPRSKSYTTIRFLVPLNDLAKLYPLRPLRKERALTLSDDAGILSPFINRAPSVEISIMSSEKSLAATPEM